MGRFPALAAIALLAAGCRVDFDWNADPRGRTETDRGEIVDGPYAVGSFAEFTAEHPRRHVDLYGWTVHVEPAGLATETTRHVRGDEVFLGLRFDEAGVGTIEIRRPTGVLADTRRFEAALAERVELETWIARRTDRSPTPLLADDGALHLTATGEEVGIHPRFFDARGRALLARGLVQARALGDAAEVCDVSDEAICLLPGQEPATGTLHVLAGRDLLAEVPLVAHAPDEITSLTLHASHENHAGPYEDQHRLGWLVAVARAGRFHTWGADVTWWEDDRWLGEGAFASVVEDPSGRTRVVTACVGDLPPGPPPPDTSGVRELIALGDTGDTDDTEPPADTDPGDTDDTEPPADTDPGDTEPPADTDPAPSGPICDTITIRGRIGGLGDDRTGSFCGCDHVPAGGAAASMVMLLALGLRRRR